MPDNSFGPELSFLNKKVKPDCHVHVTRLFCFNKQTSRTQVSDSCHATANSLATWESCGVRSDSHLSWKEPTNRSHSVRKFQGPAAKPCISSSALRLGYAIHTDPDISQDRGFSWLLIRCFPYKKYEFHRLAFRSQKSMVPFWNAVTSADWLLSKTPKIYSTRQRGGSSGRQWRLWCPCLHTWDALRNESAWLSR